MAHPEEKLADLGLSVPEVAKPVAAYIPAVRTGNLVFTSGQLPMRAGELMRDRQGRRRGQPGGGRRVRPAVRPQRARRGQGRDRRPRRGQAGRQGGRASWPRRPTSPASRRSPTAPPSCSGGLRRRRRARPVGRRGAGAAARRAGRGRAGRRGLRRAADRRCRRTWSSRRGRTPTAPAARPSRATPRPSCCCGGRRPGPRGLPAAPADVDGLRRRHVRLPRAAGSTRATSTPTVAWAGPPPADWAARLGVDEADGPGPGVRRGARDLRGVGRPAGRAVRRRGGRRHHRRRTGRPTGSRWRPASWR